MESKKKIALWAFSLFVIWFSVELWGPVYWRKYVNPDSTWRRPARHAQFDMRGRNWRTYNPHGRDYLDRHWPHSETYFTVIHSG